MKKIISILCALSMLLSMVVVAQASGVKIEIDEKTLVQGTGTEPVEVPLELSGNTGIAGMTLQISYDEGLEITGVKKGPALGSMTLTEDGDYLTANPFNLLWDGKDADATNGVIAILTFTVPKNQVKTYHVSATLDSAFDDDVQDVSIAIVNGGITVTEAPKTDFTGLSLSDKAYTYDGNEKGLAVAGNVPAGANVTYKYDGSMDKPTDVGEYDVEAVVTKDGYNDLTLNATMTINPKNLTVSGMSAQNKEYDGTANASVSGGTLSGKVSGDDVDATFPTSGTFASTNVGSNIAVSIDDITLTGSDKDNYTLTQPTGLKANITKRPITVTARSYTIRQNTAVPVLEYDITSGSLVPGDEITGVLSVNTTGASVGTFNITKGSLAISNNYNLTFVNGTLTVSAKDVQDVTVAAVPSKTYGDAPFELDVTDNSSSLGALTYTSSDTDVATVSADGTVTVKAAGTTKITVSRAGNDEHADFTVTKALTVNKKPITVTADAKSKRVGTSDPELTYTYTGTLVGDDVFSGALTRRPGEEIKTYDILQGTLSLNDNYKITYKKATFEILAKSPQNIEFAEIGEKTYGDESFALSITPDETAQLENYTYVSSNEDVATVDESGNVTVKNVGTTEISVTEIGNDEYASVTKTQILTVTEKTVDITAIDLDNKTATIEGVLAEDSAVELDFDKVMIEIIDAVDDNTSNVNVTNFVLVGEKAENYLIGTESIDTTVSNANVASVTGVADNGTIAGCGTYLVGSNITLVANANRGYKFNAWCISEETVSSSKEYSFELTEDVEITATFKKVSSGGGGGGTVATQKPVATPEPTATPETVTTPKPMTTPEPVATEEPIANDKAYGDVSAGDWFSDAVQFVTENKLMNGVSENEFAPNGLLTRAMLVTVLYRNEGEPAVEGSNTFNDIADGTYYENAVIWAQKNGIVEGYSDTEFAPDANITREQIATIIYRYAMYKGYETGYSDVDNTSYEDFEHISSYAVDALNYGVGSGLINGKTDSTINPKDNATRAEIATILQRFITTNN